jgi:hypothetical protein
MTLTGTYDISSLLAAQHQSLKDFGMQTVVQVLQADLAAHNDIVTRMVTELCEVTTDAQRIYGASASGEMVEVDEYGRAPTQVTLPGATVGFPLRLFQFNVGWTRKFLETATPADLAKRQLSAEIAHKKQVAIQIQRAIFRATNYTFRDHLIDNVDLAVKRFVNADSMVIPDGPNGETFTPASHQHYTADATPLVANYTTLIDNVVEHGHGGSVKLCINKAQEATVRGYTGFNAYIDARIIPTTTTAIGRAALDTSRVDNRAIGILGAAEVWVKSWVPATYAFCYDAGDPRKPLAFRQRTATALQGLRIAAEIDTHPLQAQYFESEYGIGVWTRTNGALFYSGDNTWADAV